MEREPPGTAPTLITSLEWPDRLSHAWGLSLQRDRHTRRNPECGITHALKVIDGRELRVRMSSRRPGDDHEPEELVPPKTKESFTLFQSCRYRGSPGPEGTIY